jgi:lipoate---protein ligase
MSAELIDVLKYNLPDINILNDKLDDLVITIWQPDKIYLVLGQSNSISESINEEHVLNDNITVLKRPTGGQTVILSPNTLVISTTINTSKFINPQVYFRRINELIMKILKSAGIEDLSLKGISDIAIGNKKILGSAIYRNNQKVFYHAVLNVSENTYLMDKYIKHPITEPDYRNGRSHNEFVTSISKEGYTISINDIKYLFENIIYY